MVYCSEVVTVLNTSGAIFTAAGQSAPLDPSVPSRPVSFTLLNTVVC